MREHGAGDSPLGWRGIPSRTQTQVFISAPFLSFARSGPVLSVSHSERIDHGCSNARGYRNRPSQGRSEEHTSELQSLMRISYAVFCLKKKNTMKQKTKLRTSMSTQKN